MPNLLIRWRRVLGWRSGPRWILRVRSPEPSSAAICLLSGPEMASYIASRSRGVKVAGRWRSSAVPQLVGGL
jgi:hypothetical protein